jgi:hypothetical protein
MKLKGLGILLMIGIFSVLPFYSIAQNGMGDPDKVGAPNVIKGGKGGSSHKSSSAEKKVVKAKEKQAKDAAKAYKAAMKYHEKIQSKQTKEMMKASKSKADAYNQNKRPPWWKRLFMKKGSSG